MDIAVDYASEDRNHPPDFGGFQTACLAEGSRASMVIMRGAYGTLVDPALKRDWRRIEDAGMIRGAYLFLRMRKDLSPQDQCHAYAGHVGVLGPGDLPPILDVEASGLSAIEEFEAVHEAWTTLRDIYGVPPMIYDSARVWSELLNDHPAGEMGESPQWVAKPWPWRVRAPARLQARLFAAGQYEPDVPKPWGPGNWWLHQYQGDALPCPGFSSTVDLSRFQVMRQGEMSVRVQWVQSRLGMQVTGVFDDRMADHVSAFQRMNGLVGDAIIGPKTFSVLAWAMGVERMLPSAA